jgi:hypothetical protein
MTRRQPKVMKVDVSELDCYDLACALQDELLRTEKVSQVHVEFVVQL